MLSGVCVGFHYLITTYKTTYILCGATWRPQPTIIYEISILVSLLVLTIMCTLLPPEGFLLNDDPTIQAISDWFIQSYFLNDKTAHGLLLDAAENGNHLLAKAFYLRFFIKRNRFDIPEDIPKAKVMAAELLPWLLQQVRDSKDDKMLIVACCEYIIAYYQLHEIIPCESALPQREEAVIWMTRSANHFYPPAVSNLGVFYDIGEGVTKDMKKAVELYQLASEMNFAPAMCNLGICVFKGQGTAKNLERAVSLFQKSHSLGFIPAATNLGYCYEKGQGVPINKSEAMKLYKEAAEQGNQTAQFNLALCYEKGEGMDKDITQAIHWYQKCATQGDQNAATKVIILQNELIADDCPICLEKANVRGRQILVTPGCCGKLFHEKCFQTIVTKYSHSQRPQCPCCREPFSASS